MSVDFSSLQSDMNRKTILVLAYSISPIRGSEYSVGWNYVREMSKDHNLIILFGLAGDHMGDIAEVTSSSICQSLPNVEWVAVRPNWMAKLLNWCNRKNIFTYSFYLAYRAWHRQAYLMARILVGSRSIDVIHYLCPIGFREPGYLWKINKPYIWGPIGGIENRSTRLAIAKGPIVGLKILFRNIINVAQFRFSPRVQAAFKHTNLILSATSGIQQEISNIYNIETVLLAENAITFEMLEKQKAIVVPQKSHIQIIWVGRIDEGKSLDILLKALSLVNSKNWRLSVLGDGPLMNSHIKLANKLNIGNSIEWVGKVSRRSMSDFYSRAHIHVISSLLEANTTVIWEAMSFGLPTVALDHFGMHDTICEKCGCKINVGDSLKEIANEMAAHLNRLIENPTLITKLSIGVLECSKKYTWEKRRSVWNNCYDLAISRWSSNIDRVNFED